MAMLLLGECRGRRRWLREVRLHGRERGRDGRASTSCFGAVVKRGGGLTGGAQAGSGALGGFGLRDGTATAVTGAEMRGTAQ
ncbi:hypothetical protein AB0952_10045 [Streptomyces caniferus]|uniref:hypothetical protein n=1 Tax=Streptomyces caniferus TaxID=285557 RepID=UPI003454C9CD